MDNVDETETEYSRDEENSSKAFEDVKVNLPPEKKYR